MKLHQTATVVRLLVSGALMLCARDGSGQDLRVEFNNGLVTVVAREVPLVQVLDRWAELGGATIIKANGLGGAITVELVDVPERAALDILLRDESGYILVPRRPTSQQGSLFEKISILSKGSSQPTPYFERNAGRQNPIGASASLPAIFQAPADAFSEPVPNDADQVTPDLPTGPSAGRTIVGVIGAGRPAPALDLQGEPGPAQISSGPADTLTAPASSRRASPNPFGFTVGAARPGDPTPAPVASEPKYEAPSAPRPEPSGGTTTDETFPPGRL